VSAVTEVELQAFVDDQLDVLGRMDVLNHLLGDPEACARTLLDLRDREVLRALAERPSRPATDLVAAAERLERALAAQRPKRRLVLGGGAAAAVLVAFAGLAVLALGGPPKAAPRYLTEAIEARRAASVRQVMASQAETPAFNTHEVRAATRIRVPVLPRGWRVTDAQVFPSDFGPALQLSLESDEGQSLSLFAVHAGTGGSRQPRVEQVGPASLVAWEGAGNTYVLAGGLADEPLLGVARDLADNALA